MKENIDAAGFSKVSKLTLGVYPAVYVNGLADTEAGAETIGGGGDVGGDGRDKGSPCFNAERNGIGLESEWWGGIR